MAAKVVYPRVLQHFAQFRMKSNDHKSQANFNATVTHVYTILADRYGKPKSTIAHLIAALGFQLLDEIEEEEGPDLIENILQGKVVVALDDNNKLQSFKVEQ